jgi:hypothetical protein
MTNDAPTFPDESPKLWQAVKTAAEAGDLEKVKAALSPMELSPRLAKLFTVAIAEHTELTATEAAAEGMDVKLQSLGFRLCALNAAKPGTVKELEKAAAECADLRQQVAAAQQAIAAAQVAARQKLWIALWLAPLFGQQELPHAGPISGLPTAPKTSTVATELGIGANVYAVGPNGWRKIATIEQPERKRKFTSFSPLIQR